MKRPMKQGLREKVKASSLPQNPLVLESLDAPLTNMRRRKLAMMHWLSQQSALREQVKLRPSRGLSGRLELRDRLRLTMDRQREFESLELAAQRHFISSQRTLIQSLRLDREIDFDEIPSCFEQFFRFD